METAQVGKATKNILWQVGMVIFTLIVYSALASWKIALLVVYMVLIHELGHIWEAKRNGIPTGGIYLVPFLGGVATIKMLPQTASVDFKISIMGPLWGFLSAITLGIAYLIVGSPVLAAATLIACAFNIFNLIPVFPLDGGRIVSTLFWAEEVGEIKVLRIISSLLGGVAIFLATKSWMVGVFVIFVGWLSSGQTYTDTTPLAPIQKIKAFFGYILLLGALMLLAYLVIDAASFGALL